MLINSAETVKYMMNSSKNRILSAQFENILFEGENLKIQKEKFQVSLHCWSAQLLQSQTRLPFYNYKSANSAHPEVSVLRSGLDNIHQEASKETEKSRLLYGV